MMASKSTHEQYVHGVRDLVIARALERTSIDPDTAARLRDVKLMYGLGLSGGYRGVTVYSTWANGHGPTDCVEIAATGEESWLQLACTTTHEYAHVLAGQGSGHSETWKVACERLGLRRAKAAGMRYTLAALDPILRERVYALARSLGDGSPAFMTAVPFMRTMAPRPCSAGYGTRGGTSRGVGSGSRLLKVTCLQCGYVARVTRTWIVEKGAPYCGIIEHGRMVEEGA
jgi:hypothetical protein